MTKLLKSHDEIGRTKRIDDALGRYLVFVKNTFPLDLDLVGLRIVLDCANGATLKSGTSCVSRVRKHKRYSDW